MIALGFGRRRTSLLHIEYPAHTLSSPITTETIYHTAAGNAQNHQKPRSRTAHA